MSAPNPYFLKLTETETLRFLDLYQREEILWNSNLDLYRNRPARLAAAERVSSALGVRGFSAEYVLIKFKNLRSSYCQELKKVAESISSGAEEVYKPKVFWFHKMNAFLRPFVQSRAAQSNLYFDSPDYDEIQTQEVCTTHFLDPFANELNSTHAAVGDDHPTFLPSWDYYDEHSSRKSDKRSYRGGCSPTPIYSKRLRHNDTKPMDQFNHHISNESQRTSSPTPPYHKEDSFDCFGKYVASLLRTMCPQTSCKKQLEIITMLLTDQTNNYKEPKDSDKSLQTGDYKSDNSTNDVEHVQKFVEPVKEENSSNSFVDLTNELNYDS